MSEILIEAPAYDPQNPDHVRRWELAGKPALDAVDGDGNLWRPTITKVLQPDGSYTAIPAPTDSPVTDVERATQRAASNFRNARIAAPQALDLLMGKALVALVAGGMSEDDATSAGVLLVSKVQEAMSFYRLVNGHPVGRAALLASIASKVGDAELPWLRALMPVFEAELA